MGKTFLTVLMLAVSAGVCAPAFAQAPPQSPSEQPVSQAPLPAGAVTRSPCGSPLAPPSVTPPADTTFIWTWELCFPSQATPEAPNGLTNIDPESYLYYVKFDDLISRPKEGVWSPWNEAAEEVALADFKSLMQDTTFLEDLRIQRSEFTFPNGAVGIIVSYIGEERERVKIVDYRDSKGEPINLIKRSDIDEKLREKNITVRLDAFVDQAMIRRVETVLDEMMTEKGFANSRISHRLTPVAGGPRLVNVTFIVDEGPKDKIDRIDFIGNTAVGDGTLRKQIKENKPKGSFITLGFLKGGGTWKETAFEEDAARIVDYYQSRGYARARVGQPELRVLRESKDGRERHVEVRVPITEGSRYRMGELTFEGNKTIRPDFVRGLFKMETGEWYSRKRLYDGFRSTQQVYGQLGYMEWTPAPMFKYSDDPDPIEQQLASLVPPMLLAPPEEPKAGVQKVDPVVNVNVLFQEGPQFFVNRITFTGNSTTRDKVIRREMRLFEGHEFDSEALKFSVRRLNQLGYFTEIHGDERDTTITKNTTPPNTVDVTMKLAEQNRNQLTFGAGVSQYEGVFGQLSFQTSNFLGRGETLTVNMTAGDRSQNYQLAFTNPYLFDRNFTGGFDVFRRSLDFIGYYTQKSAGGNLIFGFPVANFSRMFFNYAYESVKITNLNEALLDQSCVFRPTGCGTIESGDLSNLTQAQREIIQRNPFLLDSLLIGQGGSRTVSKVVPSFVHNTVDNPIFPNQGKKFTGTIDLALLGGNTRYIKPRAEMILFKRLMPRQSIGFRAQAEYIRPYGTQPCLDDATLTCPKSLPIFERLTLGGEYSIRGLDLRAVGPTVQDSLAVLGGNKSLLFNAEYLISIASQVRIVLFYDAGQVRDVGESFAWQEDLIRLDRVTLPLTDALAISSLTPEGFSSVKETVIGRTSAFKTSTGVELRFFMPVLNVPFRLIYAFNPQRGNVLDNNLQPQKGRIFRFAVGTTF
ncbi:MAG TPA: BamA/TamA family outer membrane protein [Vicinamibacterales bacterium]|nr:BamA/TamA family outer membrane protein [Vicinamibacterales bacterium]